MASKKIKSVELLPEFLRTDKNKKFLSSTIDQLIEPPQLERLDGFIGSKLTPTYKSSTDNYLPESLTLRKNYQLEPALVVKDSLGNIKEVKGIDDLANEISTAGGINNNFDRLFRSDFYSYDPKIDWDKFVNYQNYYWLTTGPSLITIAGQQTASISTYTVTDNALDTSWIFSPNGLTEDPVITLYRGGTYSFNVTSNHKFFIKTSPSLGTGDQLLTNITNNGTNSGTVSLVVDNSTPQVLYYTSDDNPYFQGQILIKSASENSLLEVDSEIVGKKSYTSGNGVALSNGMKISFGGQVIPASYQNKEFFVEGVGQSIKLVDYVALTAYESMATVYNDNFDAQAFDNYPFDNFKRLPIDSEYITINRASTDLNPWSRYNRWVHKDVIEASALANNQVPVYPADKRAKRPIIEFNAGLKLYNYGTRYIGNVDIIDTTTTDAFSFVNGASGYYADGVALSQGQTIIFNADTDSFVKGKIFYINFVTINNKTVIQLLPVATPAVNDNMSVNLGSNYSGSSWWFTGTAWQYAQQHTKLNQAPLFDLFDSSEISYSDVSAYSSNFAGNKIFGYEEGTVYDPVLGFNIKYKNNATTGVGSWMFKNYFSADTISIIENSQTTIIPSSTTFVKFYDQDSYANIWNLTSSRSVPILQFQTITESTVSSLELNAIDNPLTTEFNLEVYVNNDKLSTTEYTTTSAAGKYVINFLPNLSIDDNVLFKIYTTAPVNSNGWYETPIGLTNNPLNGLLQSVTFTEISDHLNTMIHASPDFVGIVSSSNNLRDISNISEYGNRLISNINPIAFASFFIGIKEHSLIDATVKAGDQYNQFKMAFLKKIAEINNDVSPADAVDLAMADLNKNKDVNSSWHYSDMVAYGSDKITRSWTVTDSRNTVYPITDTFDPSKLSIRSVLVYLNGNQLLLNKDYTFVPNDSKVQFLITLNKGDEIVIDDYTDTTGSYIPSTPTKLGLYPKFEPSMYDDDTYSSAPIRVIQGHDGSITVAYNDYRDDIILEFEKRIFNNIKSEYRAELLDINNVLPGAFRNNQYSLDEVNTILRQDFIKWTGLYGIDYATNSAFDEDNSRTWNYTGGINLITGEHVNGNWRAIFKNLYDTDRPHSNPWEMLGFGEQPIWWESEYGPAPYTAGNTILWTDLAEGKIRQGTNAGINSRYVRTDLLDMLPVDDYGNLIDPSTLISNVTIFSRRQLWEFGDCGAAETAWRRSSHWPFAVQRLLALTNPSTYASLMYDPSQVSKNKAGQWTYGTDKTFLNPKTVNVFGYNNALTDGYSVYVSEIGRQRSTDYLTSLINDLRYIDFNLFHKVGGFVSKNKIQLIIDAVAPNSTSPGALLPQEDYSLILNVSNPIKSVSISGIIVQKSGGSFVLKGYNTTDPYFTVYETIRNSNTPTLTVGGISEQYVNWSASTGRGELGLSTVDQTTAKSAPSGNFYQAGQIVRYGNTYYRVKTNHLSESTFDPSLYQQLLSLPVTGGATVQTALGFSKVVKEVPYGAEFTTLQEVYDVIVGYGAWLKDQGFVFDEYNADLGSTIDWDLSSKEFLYWTTQNWADGSVITVSPFANQLKYSLPASVVDDVFNSFYNYSLLNASGLPFSQKSLNVSRDDGVCTINTVNTQDGIYFAVLNSVQKEHAMVFNNTTIFNDVIYDIETGYRQLRMQMSGFRTAGWNGDYFSPGFIYDTAVINDWAKYTNYNYGDVVKFAGKYYSSIKNVVGSSSFDYNNWVLLGNKPVADLIPNFDYKINQFEDFYSLDIDNFDAGQQKMAQHLTGYTPRVYLNNIFTNPIAQYKFYQGYIKEKGTKNAVSKLAKATIFNLQGEIDFTEEWAFRIGHYGSYETYQELEIPLKEGTFIDNPQVISLVETKPVINNDLIQFYTPDELAIKPSDFVPGNTFATRSDDVFEISLAGYVNSNDVTYQVYKKDDILSLDNSTLKEGDSFWVGISNNGSWDVLRYERADVKVSSVSINTSAEEIILTTDNFHELKVNDIVSIVRFDQLVDGIYKVTGIPALDQFTVSSTIISLVDANSSGSGSLFKFSSARSDVFDALPSDQQLLKYPVGTKFWVDNNNSNDADWIVYEKIKNYNSTAITTPEVPADQKLGFTLSKQIGDNLLFVGAPGFANNTGVGKVFAYIKESSGNVVRRFNYNLNSNVNSVYDDAGNAEFGYSIVYAGSNFNDTEKGVVFVGAPGLSGAKSSDPAGGLRYATTSATPSDKLQQGAVKISGVNITLSKELPEAVLLSPNPTTNERFGHAIAVNEASNLLIVGAPGPTASAGTIYVYNVDLTASPVITNYVSYITSNSSVLDNVDHNLAAGSQFGYSISIADTGYFAVGAPGSASNSNVIVFSSTNVVSQVISPLDVLVPGFNEDDTVYGRFGETVYLTPDGNTLIISAPGHKNQNQSYGAVLIYYKGDNGLFDVNYPQVLTNPTYGQGTRFGTSFDFDNASKTLAISSVGTNNSVFLTFDDTGTTFDSASTKFFNSIEDFGTVYVYSKKSNGTRFVLAEELQPTISTETDIIGTRFGYNILVEGTDIYVGAPGSINNSTSKFYQFKKLDLTTTSLRIAQQYEDLVDTSIVEKVALYDVNKEIVVEYLDVIDPVKGRIAGIADQELKYKSSFDPARYSTGTSTVLVSETSSWVDSHVGELWWDLSSVRYTWYEQGELIYRKNNWGKLFPGSSIDVYEWVSSEYLPSQWAVLADTVEGLTQGISGQPKYADDSNFSIKEVFNSSINAFTNLYFFWVKNKVTVPNSKNRRISAYQVANIIEDPTAYGLKFAAIIDKNSLILANIDSLLVDDRIHINVSFDNTKSNIPRHTEWLLLQEGSANSRPNTLLEKKFIDSLLGHDSLGNPVPDPTLSNRMKYGVSIRPRQSLFKDRKAALRNAIEFTNDILLSNQITGNYSFDNLEKQESPPDEFSHAYDQIVEDNEGLVFVNTIRLKQARLSCTVYNGRINSVSIVEPGLGYKISPTVQILNNTTDAVITTEIDSSGQVISATIVNPGSGFLDGAAPNLVVRPFTVTVLADALYNGKWSLFTWNELTKEWVRSRTQKYNTNLYWNKVDWKSTDFNQFIDYTATVNEVYQLSTLTGLVDGQYVKVKDAGDGRYLILRKTTSGGTFNNEFDLVYSENGTIQISDLIWNTIGNDLSFDDIDTRFDQTLYDQTPDLELQYILQALRDDLFVGDLKVNWNLLFFKSVRYALTEQKLLDWAFKTSFINVVNNAGSLDQPPVYKLNRSEYYEDYLNEVKPYHTQVRSYTTNYTNIEPTQTYTTDFDLPTVYNPDTGKYEVTADMLTEYPWKSWADNFLFTVGAVNIGYPGVGYVYPPEVLIEATDGDSGSGATAVSYITSGEVTSIEITNSGSGYSKAPTVTLIGGGATTSATVYAQLFNGKVRSNTIGIKFDRISKTSTIGDKIAVDQFITNGSSNEFVLTWLTDPVKSNIDITLNGEAVSPINYRIDYYTSFYNGYNKKYSKIVFLNGVPSNGNLLTVKYPKNINLFNATDRIQNYYNASAGMPGTLAQLVDGVEYPKTKIEGLPFDYTNKWDLEYVSGQYSKFGEFSWADDIGAYTTASVVDVFFAGSDFLSLDSVENIKVGYLANFLNTSTKFSTSTDVFVTGIITATNTVQFSSTLISDVQFTEVLEFWSRDSNSNILDSAIDGGDLQLSYALGVNPEDIIIDGDSFISPNVSYAPDEMIPGYVAESVGINVYTIHTGTIAPVVLSANVEVIARTTTTQSLLIAPPNKDSIAVTFNNKLFEYNTNTVWTTTTNATQFAINWETNEIIVPPQSVSGKLGYTIVSIGSNSPLTEVGVIDNQVGTFYNTSTAVVESLSNTATVKSAYVTVNGVSIPKVTTSTDYGYMISTAPDLRAAVNVYNLSTSTTNTVQAWFFGNDIKYFNEITEQIIVPEDFLTTNTYLLSNPPGIIEPVAAQSIVELITTEIATNKSVAKRLTPPIVSYYQVTDISEMTYPINQQSVTVGTQNSRWDIRVYVNGIKLSEGADWTRGIGDVTIRSGRLALNDAIAILLIPYNAALSGTQPATSVVDYDIQGDTLIITNPTAVTVDPDALPSTLSLRVVTYNNHDGMLLRSEVFNGKPNRRFKIKRAVINENYIWVTLNGIPLINNVDFEMLDDQVTVQISDAFTISNTDKVTIMTLGSDKISSDVLGYRIFKDIFNRTHFKRLSKKSSTVLTRQLLPTDTEIHVEDAGVLTQPIPSKNIPGIVIIAGEQIEFLKVEGNVLSRLKRGILCTGPRDILEVGMKVIDQGTDQVIPFNEDVYTQIKWTTNSNAYTISTASQVVTTPDGKTINSDGITLQYSPSSNKGIADPADISGQTMIPIRAEDQIMVFYGGRSLRKSDVVYHDSTVAYDSLEYTIKGSVATANLLPDTTEIGDAYKVEDVKQIWVYTESIEQNSVNGYVYKGLNYLDAEFTVDAMTQELTLNIDGGVESGIKLVIVKKEFNRTKVWNNEITSSTTKSLIDSTTAPAKFLKAKLAELPNRYYYGR